jgi:Family of unknown function (DUF6069)
VYQSEPDRYPPPPGTSVPGARTTVDPVRLWAGGAAAALVAAGVAVVGLLIARGVFNTRILIPNSDAALVNNNSWRYALLAAGAALVATGLMHLLLLFAPSPRTFFGWIVGLGTIAAAVVPFTTDADIEVKVATGAVNLAIGIAVISTILSVARSATRLHGIPSPGDSAR